MINRENAIKAAERLAARNNRDYYIVQHQDWCYCDAADLDQYFRGYEPHYVVHPNGEIDLPRS